MSVAPDSRLIKWLHQCFREDRTRAGVADAYAAKVSGRLMMRRQEVLANGEMEEEVLANNTAVKLLDRVRLYRREKELLYGTLFVCGTISGKRYRAPLVMYPAKMDDAQGFIGASIDHKNYRINPAALEVFDKPDVVSQELEGILRGGVLSHGVLGDVRELIEEQAPQIETSGILKWPHLAASKDVDLAGSEEGLSVCVASGLLLIDRSVGARGVLDELSLLENEEPAAWSGALQGFLTGGGGAVDCEIDGNSLLVPATLSVAQQRVLCSARSNPVTICHGPPGTGKSYTIAAIAIDHIARGESVLVVSKKDHAVNVVHEKLNAIMGGLKATVRAGRKGYKRDMQQFIEGCLAGKNIDHLSTAREGKEAYQRVNQAITALDKDLNFLMGELGKSVSRGELFAMDRPGLTGAIKKWWIKGRVRKKAFLMDVAEGLHRGQRRREEQVRSYLKKRRAYQLKTAMTFQRSRQHIRLFHEGLKKVRSADQTSYFKKVDFKDVLDALPVWLTNLDDVHSALPYQKELFDVVIVDEASQCDTASLLPALQRAKRVVVAGDAQQLRHLSFVSENQLDRFAHEHDVPEALKLDFHYRNVSVMDVAQQRAASASQVGFLDEHFRSKPKIIGFSNTEFYGDALHVMQRDACPFVATSALTSSYVKGGERGDDGVNEKEVKQVVREIREFLKGQEDVPRNLKKSIGVLSPFRAQVDALYSEIRRAFSGVKLTTLLNVHRLRIGTAHSFQGEERDIMILSMAVGKGENPATMRFLEQVDVFNVSVTRAREKCEVVHSVMVDDLSEHSLLGRYLTFVASQMEAVSEAKHAKDDFAREVEELLRPHGIEVTIGQVVAGVDVDMLLSRDGKPLGLDLVGYPGMMQDYVCFEKVQMLRRAGTHIVPLGYAEWCVRKEEIVAQLVKLLE